MSQNYPDDFQIESENQDPEHHFIPASNQFRGGLTLQENQDAQSLQAKPSTSGLKYILENKPVKGQLVTKKSSELQKHRQSSAQQQIGFFPKENKVDLERKDDRVDAFKEMIQNKNKKETSFQMAMMMRRFMNRLLERTSCYRPKMLNQNSYRILNDKGSYFDFSKKSLLSQYKSFQKCVFKIVSKCSVQPINPNSKGLLFWDLLHSIFIIANIFYVPIEWAANENFTDNYGNWWRAFLLSTIAVYTIHIIMQFQIGYYDKGSIVKEKELIFYHYFGSQLFWDSMNLIPVINVFVNDSEITKLLNIVMVCKLLTLSGIFAKYTEYFRIQQKKYFTALIQLFRLLLFVMFVIHILACGIFAIGKANLRNGTQNWIRGYLNAEFEDWLNQYIYAYYWAAMTMTTVGYGDVAPKHVNENIYAIFTMIAGSWVFSFSFNVIGGVIADLTKKDQQFQDDIRLVNRYLMSKKIDEDTALEIRKYLQYKNDNEFIMTKDEENSVLDQLSTNLKDKLLIKAHTQLFDKCIFLRDNFSKEFLEQLALKAETQIYIHNQPIFSVNDLVTDDSMMYILEHGQVQMYIEMGNPLQPHLEYKLLKEYKDTGDCFGENLLFMNSNRQYSTKSIGTTSLLQLSKQQFLETVKKFNKDYQKYCMIRDHCNIQSNYSFLHPYCFICGKQYHNAKNCSKIHFVPDRERVFLQYHFSTPILERSKQVQRKFVSKEAKKQFEAESENPYDNALANFHFNQSKAQQFNENNLKLEDNNNPDAESLLNDEKSFIRKAPHGDSLVDDPNKQLMSLKPNKVSFNKQSFRQQQLQGPLSQAQNPLEKTIPIAGLNADKKSMQSSQPQHQLMPPSSQQLQIRVDASQTEGQSQLMQMISQLSLQIQQLQHDISQNQLIGQNQSSIANQPTSQPTTQQQQQQQSSQQQGKKTQESKNQQVTLPSKQEEQKQIEQMKFTFPSQNVDKLHEFEMYYPRNNITAVIERRNYAKIIVPRDRRYHFIFREVRHVDNKTGLTSMKKIMKQKKQQFPGDDPNKLFENQKGGEQEQQPEQHGQN